MAHSSLYPAFIQCLYHSSFAASHVLNLPIRDWIGGVTATEELGLSHNWEDEEVDVRFKLEALLTTLLGQFPDTVTFDRSTVFTLSAPDGIARPRATFNHTDFDGTDITPGTSEAVQKTFTFYDTEFNHVRLQLMDAASNDIWTRDTNFGVGAAATILAEFSDTDTIWSSRKGFRPSAGISIINKVNNKLRRSYGLS